MGAEHMLLPRGGYDFVQVSPTEYRWTDAAKDRSALLLAPEGTRFGWYYHVRGGASDSEILGRKPTLEAAFRTTVRSLDAIADATSVETAVPRRKRFPDEPSFSKMLRQRFMMKTQNG